MGEEKVDNLAVFGAFRFLWVVGDQKRARSKLNGKPAEFVEAVVFSRVL